MFQELQAERAHKGRSFVIVEDLVDTDIHVELERLAGLLKARLIGFECRHVTVLCPGTGDSKNVAVLYDKPIEASLADTTAADRDSAAKLAAAFTGIG